MARTEHFDQTSTLSLPVPPGTVAGDPVSVGLIRGVALTDRGDGGNAATDATVAVSPCVVHRLPVEAADGAITVGAAVYIDESGDLSNNDAGALFGAALAPVANSATATIPVLIAGPAVVVEITSPA